MAPTFVTRYLLALQRYKWVGVAGFVTVMGISGVIAIQPPPEPSYRAEGVLAPNAPPVAFTATGSEIQSQGREMTEEFLLSDYVVKTVSDGLLAQGIAVKPQGVFQKTKVRVSRSEERGSPVRGVEVTYEAAQREEAELAAQLLLQTMVEQSREVNAERLRIVTRAINERLPAVEAELRAAEQALEQYDRIEGPALQTALDGSLLGSITGSEQQQRQIRLTLSGIDAQIASLQSKLGLTPDEAYASSALSADPIIANLRAQIYQTETQIELLSQNLREEHPTMVELRQQQSAYEQLLQQRASEVIGGSNQVAPLTSEAQIRQDSSLDPARQQLANELVALQTQRESLQQQLAMLARTEQELRQQYTNLPNKQLERNRLAQVVAEKQAIYQQMVAKRIDAEAAEAETVASLRLAQPPQTRQILPETTGGITVLAIGGFVGILVGGGLIFLLDALDNTIRTLGDLQSAIREQDTSILGVLPLMVPDAGQEMPILLDSHSLYHEFYERLRSNLRRATAGKPLAVVLVTSTIAQEGKTVTAFNLAIASARAGKRTLVVEGDLRSPSQARALKVNPDPNSVIEPLLYYGDFNSCIRLVPEVENLYIAPSPGPQRQAAAILESSEMQRFLRDARGRFDLVIIDAPSLTLCNDALLLEPYTDGLLLVTRPGVSQSSMLSEVLEEFTTSDEINCLGAIINGADIEVAFPEPSASSRTLETPSFAEEFEVEEEQEEVFVGDRDG